MVPTRDIALIDESNRRSRIREDILIAAAQLRVSHLGLLAERAGVSTRLARMALHGARPYFRAELSPLRLGLIVAQRVGRRMWYEVTPAGARAARRVLALRAEAARRALRGQPRLPGAQRARRGRLRF